jgi:hypothetical protein
LYVLKGIGVKDLIKDNVGKERATPAIPIILRQSAFHTAPEFV